MESDLRVRIPCSCGVANQVELSQAGSSVQCVGCKKDLTVPPLSQLKRQSQIDVSPLSRLRQSIESGTKPFDGKCQICGLSQATTELPVRLFLGHAGAEQVYSDTIDIPCVFCDLCSAEFIAGLRLGRLKSIGKALLGAMWLLIVLIVAAVVAFVLPLIGILFVIWVFSGAFYKIAGRRANPYLRDHLNRICNLSDVLDDFDEFVLKPGRIKTLP